MGYQEMLEPESLSECRLIEILKNKCIEIPNVKSLKKSNLVEIFKRVALPMPQRRHNETTPLGKKLLDLRSIRKITNATEEDQALYDAAISKFNETDDKSDGKVTKNSSEDTMQLSKKKCLSSDINYAPENGFKRKTNDQEVAAQTGVKKRQKIMWP